MGLKNYYSPQQAITFLQDNGNPNFDEHDLTMLVVDGILNPLFFFQGVLAYKFVPSYADCHNYITSNDGQNPREMEMLLNFQGHISPKENEIAVNISKPHTPYSTYFLKVRTIEIKKMYPLVDEHEVEFYDYHEANIQIERVDGNETIFQLSCIGNPLFEDELGIRFSSDECRFSLVELKKLLPTPPELKDTPSDNEKVESIEYGKNGKMEVSNNLEKQILKNELESEEQQKFALNLDLLTGDDYEDFKMAVLIAIRKLGFDPDKYIVFKEGKAGVKSKVRTTLKDDPRTVHLLGKNDHFNYFWQKMRIDGILKSDTSLIKKQ